MFESENASRSSVESERRTESKPAAPTPREDLPSLQMLEESAAKLAALRQRAEYLLDQLSTGNADVPPHAAAVEEDLNASRAFKDQGGNEIDGGQSTPTVTDDPATPLSSETDVNAPWAFDTNSTNSGPSDRDSAIPDAQKDSSLTDHPSPHLFPGPQSPQGTGFQQSQQTKMPDAEEEPTFQAGPDPTNYEGSSSPAYPIQRIDPPPSSILDRPIGAAPRVFNRQAEPGYHETPTEAQLIEEEIFGLYEAINRVLETRRENTGHALSLLREAREIISAEPQLIHRAEYNIQQARQILDRARTSRRRSRGLALRTVGRLILWLAVLGGLGAALYLYPQQVDEIVEISAARVGWDASFLNAALWAVVAGGVGGCLGTISFLVERMRVHQEFDQQYIVRSTVQPLMGALLGLSIFGILAAVFNSLDTSITVHQVTSYLPAALALPIGFWQEYVYALIFRLTRLFTFQRRRRW